MISVIVPVYNVELYLKECIDSILSQSYTDFELLLIDDGSTDSSYDICKEYESKDKRIKVYQKTNGGVSSARNMGIDNANGEWIVFIDSDDYIGSEYLYELLSFKDNISCDISLIKGFIKHQSKKEFFINTPKYISIEKAIEAICGENGLCLAPWGKLFKKEIIYLNNIRFKNGLSFCEDLIFCFEYFKYVKSKVFVCNDTSYYYREVNNSLTHKIVNYKEVIRVMELQLNDYLYYKNHYSDNIIIKKHFVSIIVNCILRIGEQVFNDDLASKKEIIKKCKICTNYINEDFHFVKIENKQKIKYHIIKHLPYILIEFFYNVK